MAPRKTRKAKGAQPVHEARLRQTKLGFLPKIQKPSTLSKKAADQTAVDSRTKKPQKKPGAPVDVDTTTAKPAAAKPATKPGAVKDAHKSLSADDGLSAGEIAKARAVTRNNLEIYYAKKIHLRRKTPQVHQVCVSIREKILRHFDMSMQYGPCIGSTRSARWNRAADFGLSPPIEVLSCCLFPDAGDFDPATANKAYIEKLLYPEDGEKRYALVDQKCACPKCRLCRGAEGPKPWR